MRWLHHQTQRFALWLGAILVAWATPPPPTPLTDPVEDAVRLAYIRVGLPTEQFGPTFDLAGTGKIYDVLHYAGLTLGADHGLRTVGDLVQFYKSK